MFSLSWTLALVSPDICGVCRGISDLPGSGPGRVGQCEGDGGGREGAAGHLLPGGELHGAGRWLLDLVEPGGANRLRQAALHIPGELSSSKTTGAADKTSSVSATAKS